MTLEQKYEKKITDKILVTLLESAIDIVAVANKIDDIAIEEVSATCGTGEQVDTSYQNKAHSVKSTIAETLQYFEEMEPIALIRITRKLIIKKQRYYEEEKNETKAEKLKLLRKDYKKNTLNENIKYLIQICSHEGKVYFGNNPYYTNAERREYEIFDDGEIYVDKIAKAFGCEKTREGQYLIRLEEE